MTPIAPKLPDTAELETRALEAALVEGLRLADENAALKSALRLCRIDAIDEIARKGQLAVRVLTRIKERIDDALGDQP